MTDPNSEMIESADSNQEKNNDLTPDHQINPVKNEAKDASTGEPDATVAPPVKQDSTSTPVDKAHKKQRKPKAAANKSKKGKSKGNQKKDFERKSEVSEKFSRKESRGFQLTADGLLRHFLGCRVCCYFLSGVQVLYGREVVNRLVAEFDGTWMYVPLNRETRTLLQKTYGVRVDEGDFFIEHACEVCCRRFVIDLPEPEDYVATDEDDSNLEEPERREPIIFEPTRTREEREPDWEQDRPMMLVEFKHRR